MLIIYQTNVEYSQTTDAGENINLWVSDKIIVDDWSIPKQVFVVEKI